MSIAEVTSYRVALVRGGSERGHIEKDTNTRGEVGLMLFLNEKNARMFAGSDKDLEPVTLTDKELVFTLRAHRAVGQIVGFFEMRWDKELNSFVRDTVVIEDTDRTSGSDVY